MNIFEGARRIAMIVAGLSVLVTLAAVYQQDPYINLKYRVATFGATPVRSEVCDHSQDAIGYFPRVSKKGHKFHTTVCFAASKSLNGQMLVPYSVEGEYLMMNSPFSAEVRSYKDAFEAFVFAPSEADLKFVDSEYSSAALWKWINGLGYLCLGLFIFWLFVYAIGWVARGFAGIPSGQDKK